MPTFKAYFTGRQLGAIGIFHPCQAVIEADDKEAARLKLYDAWEHIQDLILVHVPQLNHCDHGHETKAEVRLLPTGGGGNMIVCCTHYRKEIVARLEHQKKYGSRPDLPMWGDLKIYDPTE